MAFAATMAMRNVAPMYSAPLLVGGIGGMSHHLAPFETPHTIALRERELERLGDEQGHHHVVERSAATAVEQEHDSGWKASIVLDSSPSAAAHVDDDEQQQQQQQVWRSGDSLAGHVLLERNGKSTAKRVTSVIVRAYWQATTPYLYTTISQNERGTGVISRFQTAAAAGFTIRQEVLYEYHRGYCDQGEGVEVWQGGELDAIRRELERDFPSLLESSSSTSRPQHARLSALAHENDNEDEAGAAAPTPPPALTPGARTPAGIRTPSHRRSCQRLPFAFSLPTSTSATFSNTLHKPPADRRILRQFVRAPPPSFADEESNVRVEWIVECIVRTEDEEEEHDARTLGAGTPAAAHGTDGSADDAGRLAEAVSTRLRTATSDDDADGEDESTEPLLANDGADDNDATVPARRRDTVHAQDPSPPPPPPAAADLPPPPPADVEPPTWRAASQEAMLSRAGHLLSSPNVLAHRVAFAFEPRDEHAQDLYSAWTPRSAAAESSSSTNANSFGGPLVTQTSSRCPEELYMDPVAENLDQMFNTAPGDDAEAFAIADAPRVPTFSRDVRDEALGGTLMHRGRRVRSSVVHANGGPDRWSSFEKLIPMRNAFGKTVSWLRVEMSVPFPATVTRQSDTLPVAMHLSLFSTSPAAATVDAANDGGGGKKKRKKKPRTAAPTRVMLMLCSRTSTRGGRGLRPHFSLAEVRRAEFTNAKDSLGDMTLVAPGGGASSEPARSVDVRLELPLQTRDRLPSGKESTPMRELPLSLRVPNLEHEYVLSATLFTSSKNCFYVLRCPIQLVAGSSGDGRQQDAGAGAPSTTAPLPPPYEA